MKPFFREFFKHILIFAIVIFALKQIIELASVLGVICSVIIFFIIVLLNDKVEKDGDVQVYIEDILNRNAFIKEVAAFLENSVKNEKQGNTLLIDGEWGSGKTTLIKLVDQKLQKESFKFVYFNPLETSLEENLFTEFFSTITEHKDLKYTEDFFSSLLNNFGPYSGIYKSLVGYRSEKKKRLILKKLYERKERVVLVFDDLDRLTPKMCYEAFKLIAEIRNDKYAKYISILIPLNVNRLTEVENIEKLGANYFHKFFDQTLFLETDEQDVVNYIESEISKIKSDLNIDLSDYLSNYSVHRQNAIKYRFLNFSQVPLVNIRRAEKMIQVLRTELVKYQNELNQIDIFNVTLIKAYYPEILKLVKDNSHLFISNEETKSFSDEDKAEANALIEKVKTLFLTSGMEKDIEPAISLLKSTFKPFDDNLKNGSNSTHGNYLSDGVLNKNIWVKDNFQKYINLDIDQKESYEEFENKFNNFSDLLRQEQLLLLTDISFLEKALIFLKNKDTSFSKSFLKSILESYQINDHDFSHKVSEIIFKIIDKLHPDSDSKKDSVGRIRLYKKVIRTLCENGNYKFALQFTRNYNSKSWGYSNEDRNVVYSEITDYLKESIVKSGDNLKESFSETDFHYYFTETEETYNFEQDFLDKIFSDNDLYSKMITFYDDKIEKYNDGWVDAKNRFMEKYEHLQDK